MKDQLSNTIINGLVAGVSLLTLAIQAEAADYCTDAPVNGAVYKLINADSDLLLGASSDKKKASLELQKDSGAESQRFFLNHQSSSNSWALQATDTSYAATVEGGSRFEDAIIQQKPFGDSASQKWTITQVSSGSDKGAFELVNTNSSLTLTADGSSKGSSIRQNTDKNLSSQRWWLEPTSVDCSDSVADAPADTSVLKAFPTAEGYGKNTTGGRGGKVYIVTNLNDSGKGSLREAVEAKGPRTVVFEVSGTIKLEKALKISNDDITIAGQTAPGDGITLRKNKLSINADNVIVRYIRVRYGDETLSDDDAISMRGQKNIILDHVTASWGDDETMSLYHGENVTVQWSMITESLNRGGVHAFGGIWGSPYSTFHHNLIAHNVSRNMRFASGSGYTDYRNNVVYNWGYEVAYGGENQQKGTDFDFTSVNFVGNYYKPGPASTTLGRLLSPSTRNGDKDLGEFYVAGNVLDGDPEVTADNSKGVRNKKALVDKPWNSMKINGEQTAEEAYKSVLEYAGASKVRDSVDERIVYEVRTGTATYGNGIIESQDEVGGFPYLSSDKPPADNDRDGMADDWELENGLDPSDSNDRNKKDSVGYTMLEKYINSLVN